MADEFIITAGTVVPMNAPPIEDGAVVVSNGLIEAVMPAEKVPSGLHREEYPDCILLPAFVNAHTHLVYTSFRGLADDADFFTWLTGHIIPAGTETSDDTFRESASLGVKLSFRNGITALGESHFSTFGRQAMIEGGMKGVYFYEVFGLGTLDLESGIKRRRRELEELLLLDSSRIRLGVSPHAPYSVTKPMAEMAVEIARKHNLPMSTHVAETVDEIEFFETGEGRFSDVRHNVRFPKPDGARTSLKYFDELGILTPSTMVVHGIYLNDSDIDLISERGSTLVTCPTSNLKLGCGIPPAEKWVERDIPVCIATDSLASGESFDLFEEMRRFVLFQRGLTGRTDLFPAKKVLEMVTINPARAMGIDKMVGDLTPGTNADLLLVKPEKIGNKNFRDAHQNLVWGTRSNNIIKVWSDGVEVGLQNG